jgi:hypothetical protein
MRSAEDLSIIRHFPFCKERAKDNKKGVELEAPPL